MKRSCSAEFGKEPNYTDFMDDNFAPEVAVDITPSEDKTEIVIRLKSHLAMSTNDVCIELETLAHELSKADFQKRQPGVSVH